ncbi:MAG: hypothetical protein K2M93_01130 [Muribaculaceae bacterium]|nr:hypothetical protein [Muribaculaceae bacterium]
MKIYKCICRNSRENLGMHRLMILISLILLIPVFTAGARKKSYHFKTIKETEDNTTSAPISTTIADTAPDSIALRRLFPQGRIITAEQMKSEEKPIFTGFDKRLGNSKESFFIINHSATDIEGAVISLTYRTPDGRMLHHRYAIINAHIPSGETRNIVIGSWDTQRSFYYMKSETDPRRGNPFDIALHPVAIILKN